MPDEREKFSLAEMIEHFDLSRVSLGGPIFDLEKLSWLNGQWLRELNLSLNKGEDCSELWAQWPIHGTLWQQHARSWSQKLLREGDLVTRLVKFLESRI